MLCTDNPCLVFLIWILIIVFSPLIIVIFLLSSIIYNIYNTITCRLVCCNTLSDEFGDRFDTSAPHYNHKNGRFQNYWDSYIEPKWYEWLIRFLYDMNPPKAVDYNSAEKHSKFALEYDPIQWDKINSFHSQNNGKINYLWFGHASCLIQVDGFNILTDPIFSDRASAFQFIGPKRYDLLRKYRNDIYKSIPIIDAIIISHDHYDHLDFNTITTLYQANKIKYFVVPLRVKEWLIKECNVSANNIIELDWYYGVILNKKGFTAKRLQIHKEAIDDDEYYQKDDNNALLDDPSEELKMNNGDNKDNGINILRDGELKLICVPTQHFSGRTLYDRDYRLWCGWILISKSNKKIYFGGDTGCCSVPRKDRLLHNDNDKLKRCPVFEWIGNKYGPIDLGLIPIGAYSPRWFMSRVHLNPYDACFVFQKIKAKKAIGIHWGSFYLSDEDYDEPPKVLQKAKQKYNIKSDNFIVVKHGYITQI